MTAAGLVNHGMLVAKKSATVRDEDGQPVQLVAGQDFVRAGHYLTSTYPDLFAPGSEAAKYSVRSSARDWDRGDWRARLNLPSTDERPKWKPLVRFQDWAEPTFTIQVSRRAYRDMADIAYSARLRAYRDQGEINETGGALYGVPPREQDTAAAISSCGEPGPRARTSPGRMHVDCDHIRREAIALQRSGSQQRWIGHWHTHTDPDCSGKPSQADLMFFAWDCREWWLQGRFDDQYVALILTPTWERDEYAGGERYVSWTRPAVHGWHVRAVSDDEYPVERNDIDQFIVQPANVELQP